MTPSSFRLLHPNARIESRHSRPGDKSQSYSSYSTEKARLPGPAAVCEACRQRKKKCDRKRPACSRCVERQLDCAYPGPPVALNSVQQERLNHLINTPGSLAKLLSALPYEDALELVDVIRKEPSSNNKESPLGHNGLPLQLNCTSLPPSPSEHLLLGSVLPASPDSMEFELLVRHPIAYPVLHPLQAGSLPLDNILPPSRINFASLKADFESLDRPSLPFSNSHLQQSIWYLESQDQDSTAPTSDPLLKRPSFLTAADFSQFDISQWTTIPISNQTAIRIIRIYFHNDFPVLPLFNAELFIKDLTQPKGLFCSRLLVSALLGWGCQSYASREPEAVIWAPRLFKEAELLWNQLGRVESVTLCSVAALQLMAMTAVTYGEDTTAIKYHKIGLELAESMGLLNVLAGSASAHNWLQGFDDWTKAASYTAWGVFNWASVFTLHYHNVYVRLPPTLPTPGDIDDALAVNGFRRPLDINVQVFQQACKLWCIFLPVIREYYAGDDGPSLEAHDKLKFAERTYRQLLAWADALPLSLVRHPSNGHAVIMLHVYYHAAITDVFRPIKDLPIWRSQLRTFSANHATARAAYRASIEHLKRLLLLSRLNFRLAAISVQWQTCLIYVVNSVIYDNIGNRDEVRFYLNLCLAGLKDLYASYKVFGSITKGIIGMAVRDGAITWAETVRIRQELKRIGRRYLAVDKLDGGEQGAKWIIDLQLSLTNAVQVRGENLAA